MEMCKSNLCVSKHCSHIISASSKIVIIFGFLKNFLYLTINYFSYLLRLSLNDLIIL